MIAGCARGSALLIRTWPRLVGRRLRTEGGIGFREPAELARRHRERPGAEEGVLEHNHRLAPKAPRALIHRDGVLALERHPELQVILQVFADAGELVRDGDPVPPERFRRG